MTCLQPRKTVPSMILRHRKHILADSLGGRGVGGRLHMVTRTHGERPHANFRLSIKPSHFHQNHTKDNFQ